MLSSGVHLHSEVVGDNRFDSGDKQVPSSVNLEAATSVGSMSEDVSSANATPRIDFGSVPMAVEMTKRQRGHAGATSLAWADVDTDGEDESILPDAGVGKARRRRHRHRGGRRSTLRLDSAVPAVPGLLQVILLQLSR
eukprot:TRINITY_DN2711_c0_g1_i3.p2 TRINITY_DN2711_c0_g1~~TRINITY_DN2711_c0_g1_i3.p2  ORF type:complete len:138 (-),score=27.63 TRINITY_DN2711_c0_g1_i3:744-1157(-)